MEERNNYSHLSDDLDEIEKRLSNLESLVRHQSKTKTKSFEFGPEIWVLVPVAAIIMWGLTQIFG